MAEQSLGTFGEIDDDEELENLDGDPVPFELIGYEVKKGADGKHKRQVFTFHVRPSAGFGPVFNVLSHANDEGIIPTQIAAQFIADALVQEDQDRFMKTLRRADVEFHAKVIQELAEALATKYGLRPTAPRSARRAGPRRTGATSTGGRSGRASTSTTKKRATRSTSSTR